MTLSKVNSQPFSVRIFFFDKIITTQSHYIYQSKNFAIFFFLMKFASRLDSDRLYLTLKEKNPIKNHFIIIIDDIIRWICGYVYGVYLYCFHLLLLLYLAINFLLKIGI